MFTTHIENKITMNIFYKTTMKTKQFDVNYHHYQSDNYNGVYVVSVVNIVYMVRKLHIVSSKTCFVKIG
mgnify:CR=1 FL=1